MNAGKRREKAPLSNCPMCGLDSGERFQSEQQPFLYYVRCASCGAVTRGYKAKTGATVAWRKGDVRRV